MQNQDELLHDILDKLKTDSYLILQILVRHIFVTFSDVYRPDYFSLTGILEIRTANGEVYSNGLSRLLTSVTNTKSFKILFPSSEEQYQMSHQPDRAESERAAKYAAVQQVNQFVKFLSAEDLKGTPDEKKEFMFELLHNLSAIPVVCKEGDKPIITNLTSQNSGIEPCLRSSEEFIRKFIVLIAMLPEVGKFVLQLQQAIDLNKEVGESVMLLKYRENLYVSARCLYNCCDVMKDAFSSLATQCKLCADSTVKVSTDWLRNYIQTQENNNYILQQIKQIQSTAVRLEQCAINGNLFSITPEQNRNMTLVPPQVAVPKLASLVSQHSGVFVPNPNPGNVPGTPSSDDVRQQREGDDNSKTEKSASASCMVM